MDVDQITFKDLFHIQARVETEAKKSGIKLDYSEFDGTLSGVPFNLPAVVIRSDGVTGADFIWQSSGMITSEDICRVHTRMLQDELQIRRYNSYGFLSGSIHRLYGEPHAKLLSLLNKGMKTWDKDDYSVPLCDGSSWELRLYSRKNLSENYWEPSWRHRSVQKSGELSARLLEKMTCTFSDAFKD